MNNRMTGPSIAVTKCFYCGESDKIVISKFVSRPSPTVEAMQDKVIDMEPCSKCKDFMRQGIILLTIDEAKSEKGWNIPSGQQGWMPNPYRAGGFAVVKQPFIERLLEKNEKMLAFALKHRWMFIEHEAAVRIGCFPKKEEP